MQSGVRNREQDWWSSLMFWARHAAFDASEGMGGRVAAWLVLAAYAAFVFGFAPLIWFTWHEWDFCRIAHIFSVLMPVYWIYLAVKLKQRYQDGERLVRPSDEEVVSRFEGWRTWRVRLYRRTTAEKVGDVVMRVLVLGAIALIFRPHIEDNGYFWLVCVELGLRVLLMVKRPGHLGHLAAEPPEAAAGLARN